MPSDRLPFECGACDSASSLEQLGHGWRFCSTCGAVTLFDATGQVVKVHYARETRTQADPALKG